MRSVTGIICWNLKVENAYISIKAVVRSVYESPENNRDRSVVACGSCAVRHTILRSGESAAGDVQADFGKWAGSKENSPYF